MKALPYKWLVAIVVIFGVFMVLLDTTIVNIAIPRLQTDFGAALTDVDWVSSGYTLAEGIGIPLTPFFSGMLGEKRYYLLILTLFTIGSALCGLAWSLTALIVFRILQGLAGAAMLPMSITLLYSEFPPEERGIALGALGFPLLLAPALGPSVGGYIVTFVSWRVLFYINVPVGLIGLFLGYLFLRDTRPEAGRRRSFDFVGFVFSSIGLGSLIYGLDKAGADGWSSFTVLGFMTLGFFSLATFVVVELVTIRQNRQPLLDLRIFGVRSFTGGNIAMMTVVFALFGGQFMVPLYLQNLRGLSAYDAGLVLLPQAFGSMVASLIGGRLVDKLGVKAVVLPGLTILAFALWGFSRLTLQTPFSMFQALLIIRGLGLGLTTQPTSVAALWEMKPSQLAQASSLNSVVRSMTSALAVATVATYVTARTTYHSVRLAEQVTVGSMAGLAMQREAEYLVSQGMAQQNAMTYAMALTDQEVQRQAYLLAMNDTFLVTLAVIFLTVLVVMFVVVNPRKKAALASASKKQKQMLAEGKLEYESATGSSISTSSLAVSPGKRAAIQERKKETFMKRFMRRSVLIPAAIILAAIIIIGGIGDLLYNNYNFYSTDDAQVTGQIVNVITPVSGTLINLSVQVGDEVSAQQIIGTIQPPGYQPVQHLIAPENGVIVQVLGVVGQLVATQAPIVQETDPSTVYVTAYVDESAISNIAVGQAVDIHVDAYNTTLPGYVTQIVGAAASEFSLLPTSDNSSGNYTKVGQRIPVYIQLSAPSQGLLLPGMSVEVKIHLH
jgi:EmrB/QacA subfamily drug resistance transporter